MSTDFGDYDRPRTIREAEEHEREYLGNAEALSCASAVLELVATRLSDEIDRARFHGQDIGSIVLGSEQLIVAAGEVGEADDAIECMRFGVTAVGAARKFELGKAKAARQTADFVQGKLDHDTAAEDFRSSIKNG